MTHIGFTSLHCNPLHEGHLSLLRDAKSKCDILHVIVNSNEQVLLRGSCPFLDENFRKDMLSEFKCVDIVSIAIDKDGTVSETIKSLVEKYVFGYRTLDTISQIEVRELRFSFFKGGSDRSNASELPASEVKVCTDYNIDIQYGTGGFNKANSSSTALSKAFKWYIQKVEAMSKEEKLTYFRKIGI